MLAELFQTHGGLEHYRRVNGSEFLSGAIRSWLKWIGLGIMYIASGSPGEDGYARSFHCRERDEFMNCDVF